MKVFNEDRDRQPGNESSADFVDMRTIRSRVARIKNGWTPEISRARAVEGARRRRELDALLAERLQMEGHLYASEPHAAADSHGLSLVG